MKVLCYLAMIPNVIWSALVASAVTLFGVMLSNRGNAKRQREQLAHDAHEREKERLNSLRKEVYLRATEEGAKVHAHFARLPHIDPAKEDVSDGLKEFFAAAARVQLVAQLPTARLFAQLTQTSAEILMRLLVKARPIHELNEQVRLADQFYTHHHEEVTRTLAAMTQLNESGKPDPDRFAALQRSCESAKALATQWAVDRERANGERASALVAYNAGLFSDLRTLGALHIRIAAAMRTDIGLKTEPDDYLEDLEKGLDGIGEAMAKFQEDLAKEN
jgi:hypothetical protein